MRSLQAIRNVFTIQISILVLSLLFTFCFVENHMKITDNLNEKYEERNAFEREYAWHKFLNLLSWSTWLAKYKQFTIPFYGIRTLLWLCGGVIKLMTQLCLFGWFALAKTTEAFLSFIPYFPSVFQFQFMQIFRFLWSIVGGNMRTPHTAHCTLYSCLSQQRFRKR